MASSNHEILLDPRTGEGRPDLDALAVSRLSSLLTDAPEVAAELLNGANEEQADALIVFRTISAVAAHALGNHDVNLFSQAIRSFEAIWKLGDRDAMLFLRTPAFEASLWEPLVVELFALGGLAVRGGRWDEFRELVLQEPSSRGVWLRQGQVASSRDAQPEDSLLQLAARRARHLDPDASDEKTLSAVCQADFLAAVIISEADPDGYFPNAAEFGEGFVEELVIGPLRDNGSSLRRRIFSEDDEALREALRLYDEKARLYAAQQRGRGETWNWRGFSDYRSLLFIVAGQRPEGWEGGGGWS